MQLSETKIKHYDAEIRLAKNIAMTTVFVGLIFSFGDVIIYNLFNTGQESLVGQLLNTAPKLSLAVFGLTFLRRAFKQEYKLQRIQKLLKGRRYATVSAS